jgi:ELP3 family radical SAM enzyme/protein acetyltransferase
MSDIEDLCHPAVDSTLVAMIDDLVHMDTTQYETNSAFNKTMNILRRKYKVSPSKRDLGLLYTQLSQDNPKQYPMIDSLKNILITKAVRSDSGILNVTVALPPNKFSCRYNCFFCPNEPGVPRSYLSNGDVFQRAASVGFDTVQQIRSRLDILKANGHPIDKIEFRVLGGTFSCYPHDVTDLFIRDSYYAANTYGQQIVREPRSIEEEQSINMAANVHVVGFGVETRPDEINEAEIIRFRHYGITRVELGVQHTDDHLLKLVNRGHTTAQSKKAIQLLKDYGFKIEIHIMADLPGATPAGDKDCYRLILRDDPDLIPDYLKDYPCLDVSYTTIKQWKITGQWKPYAEQTPDAKDLKEVLIYRQEMTPKWVRVNRVQRDFMPASETPDQLGYTSTGIKSNLGQTIKTEAEARGIYCQCIRCREIRDEKFNPTEITFLTETFPASGALEYFISAEVPREHRNLLLGFIRLRISNTLVNSIIPELRGKTAMIRELHVYGRLKEVGVSASTSTTGAQHLGIGKKLLQMAEIIAGCQHHQEQMAIISGVGVRDYYHKNGYRLVGSYMIKTLNVA